MEKIVLLFALISGATFSSFGQEENKSEEIICSFGPQPTFPGGLDSLKTFIEKNLKYPHRTKDVSGIVFVEFTVNEDGSVSDLKVVKGLCDPCNKNALEALSKMPKWIPVNENGKPTKSKMIIPITFKL